MASFTLGELAKFKDVSYTTMKRRMRELKENNKFKKRFPGKTYTETEAKDISELLDFTIPQLNGHTKTGTK